MREDRVSPPQKHRRSHMQRRLIVGGIIILIIIFLIFVDVKVAFGLLLQTNWWVYLAGIVFLLVGYAFNTLRWRYLLTNKPAWSRLFRSDSIAYMSNMVTPVPTSVSRILATDLVTSASGSQATSGMVVDRLLEMMMRLIAAVFVVSFLVTRNTENSRTILTNLGIIVLGIGGLVWVTRHQELVVDKLGRWLGHLPRLSEAQVRKTVDNLLQSLARTGSAGHLIVGLIISLVMGLFFVVFQYLTLTALQPPPTHIDRQTLLIALGILILIPPSTTAMVGLYHSIVIGVLAGFQLLDINTATAYAILLHLPQMGFWLIAGSLALRKVDLNYKQLLDAIKKEAKKDQETLPEEDVTY